MRIIPIKDGNISLSIFDNETGKTYGGFGFVDLSIDVTEENNQEQIRGIESPDFEITFDNANPMNFDGLLKVLGVDWSNKPDAYDVQFVKFVQARKHHKKRMNKKWLKRYGVKQISVSSKGWKLQTHTDGTYEFVKQ